jgi:hypothetical protein
MNSDIEMLSAISAGYRRAADRLESLRIKDIRESDTAAALQSFDLAFRSIMKNPMHRRTYPLTKAQRRFLGVDL